MVKKLYDLKGIEYTTKEAQVNEYEELAKVYGTNGPLVYNTETKEGITGYDIPKLLKVAGLWTATDYRVNAHVIWYIRNVE